MLKDILLAIPSIVSFSLMIGYNVHQYRELIKERREQGYYK